MAESGISTDSQVSVRQIEILNYCPDGGNGNFHCSSSFLKATSLIFEAQLSFAAHQKYILCFFSL